MTLRRMTRSPRLTDAKNVTLGKEYTDIVTGIKGKATIIYVHLTGCDQVCLSYVAEGKEQYQVVDATRLDEVVPAKNARSGGPASPVPTRGPLVH